MKVAFGLFSREQSRYILGRACSRKPKVVILLSNSFSLLPSHGAEQKCFAPDIKLLCRRGTPQLACAGRAPREHLVWVPGVLTLAVVLGGCFEQLVVLYHQIVPPSDGLQFRTAFVLRAATCKNVAEKNVYLSVPHNFLRKPYRIGIYPF